MHKTSSLIEKLSLFSTLLFPILITQISLFLMNFFDTVMSGRVSASDLAGVAIGSSLWVPIFTGVNGILLAITPIVSHLIGANKENEAGMKVQQAIYLSISLALLILVSGTFVLNPILSVMDLEPVVRQIALYYLIALGTGIIPLCIFNTLRSFIDALGKTRISMLIILLSLPINIFFNYIFIFGKLGLPTFGGVGAGIATSVTYWFVCLLTVGIIYYIQPFTSYNIFSTWLRPALLAWWEQLKIGIPIGFAIFFETSIFSAITLLMSVYSTNTIAAHQAALNFASLLYMIPLSVGMALTIAISYEVGAKRFHDARQYGNIGIASGVGIAIFCGCILFIFNEPVAKLYSTNPEVIKQIKHFIYYAIVFQLADAFGAPIQGALRGYKDVNLTLILAFISYWMIGLPSGWLLANYTSFGPFGYWGGLIIGLSFGAFALLFRLLYLQRKSL
ncbi:MATE family efflux transporter [Virgibacillus sp. W0430]|uniref:MATE family efflux transporter n=1 Tax=Virgibacillus sp. W0430 TaxID=3391580 RepID=UPI003F45F1D4